MIRSTGKVKKVCGRVEKGSEIVRFFRDLALKEGIGAAEIRGIGAFLSVTLGEFEPDEGRYRTLFEGRGFFELVSLLGNISMKGGEPVVHLHSILSFLDEGGNPQTRGGHLLRGEVFLVEFFMDTFPEDTLEREFDPETSLYIWR